MPREDNAAVLAAAAIARLATPGPVRLTPVMERFISATADALGEPAAGMLRGLLDDDPAPAEAALAAACDPMYARTLRALVRDTISPDVVHAGIKYNVIPGEAVIEIDCRVLPGMTEADARAVVEERLGPELAAACEIEHVIFGAPAESPADHPLFELLGATVREHDPDGVPVPFMVPFATDAKHTAAPRRPDLRLLAPAAGSRGALPRTLPRGRRARRRRRAALGVAGPLRRGAPLLRLTP